jgi:hypothetical protein
MEDVDDLKDDARLRTGTGGGGMGVNVEALDVRIEEFNNEGEVSVLGGGGEMNSLIGFMGDCEEGDIFDAFFLKAGCSKTAPTVDRLSLPIVVGAALVAGGQYFFPAMGDFFGFLS